jgi:catechol 2,3-dioxygenase-like lactoylglutathione lyase family enzyme
MGTHRCGRQGTLLTPMRSALASACLCVLLMNAAPSSAQLSAAREGPVVYGHHHVNATRVAAHTTFFVDALGGVPLTIGGRQVVKFPNVLVFLREQAPTGGSVGTTADHLGLAVPDLRPVIGKLKAGGYRMITRASVPADWAVVDDITRSPAGGRPIAFVLGPDDLKVELVQIADQAVPVALQHVHFFGPQRDEMQAWYVKVFGARASAPAAGARFLTATLPGVSLNFTASPTPVIGTKGRVVDHVGFEIDGLPAFLSRVAAMGITPDGVRDVPDLGTSIAFITDPWGTLIELTEGLDRIQ